MAKPSYPAWQHRHTAVLLCLLEKPHLKIYQVAAETGYSRTHVSRVVNSPEFRRHYVAARDAYFRQAYARSLRPRTPRHP